MRPLDMTPYRPYRPMGISCLTRPIREKQVRWLKPEPEPVLGGRFRVRPLSRADFGAAAELWRQAYPEVYGSSHDFLLYPEDYESRLALVETWEADALGKPCCMLLAEEVATSRLAAATLMTKFDQNLQIEYTFAGTHPDYRRLGLMGALVRVMDRLVRASGAEYLTAFLETWHTITQEETLKRGGLAGRRHLPRQLHPLGRRPAGIPGLRGTPVPVRQRRGEIRHPARGMAVAPGTSGPLGLSRNHQRQTGAEVSRRPERVGFCCRRRPPGHHRGPPGWTSSGPAPAFSTKTIRLLKERLQLPALWRT